MPPINPSLTDAINRPPLDSLTPALAATPIFTSASPRDSKKSQHELFVALVVGVVLAISGGGLLVLHANQTNNPNKVFEAALKSAYSTRYVQQTITSSPDSETILYDLTSIKDPRISTSISQYSDGSVTKINGYGTIRNSYIEYTKVGSINDSNLINKWVQLRKNTALLPGIDASADGYTDPRYYVFGNFIFGNFSPSDRLTLVKYALANHVYAYKASGITKSRLNGKAVYIYDVTENTDKLKSLSRQVATAMGIKISDIALALDNLGTTSPDDKLYIEIGSKRLVKVISSLGGITSTNSYAYNPVALPVEPKADDGYVNLQTIAALDSAKQSDIQSIQAQLDDYYKQKNHYPSLTELDSTTWRSANLPAVDSSVSRDIDGSYRQLAAKVYTYAPFNSDGKPCSAGDTSCSHYKLTATLDDGSLYEKDSLNNL